MKYMQGLLALFVLLCVSSLIWSQETTTSTSTVGTESVAATAATEATTTTAAANPPAEVRTRFGSLDVPVRISGQNFTVRFSPERKTSVAVAQQICTDKAAEIGVTNENYDNCVNNLANYLQDYVNEWTNEKILRFPITINETEFSLRFIPEIRSAKELSMELCEQYSKVSNQLFENETNCIAPIQRYIQNRINSFYAEKTLELPLTINNNFTFNIRFLPERQAPIEVATSLCVQYATPLELTEATIRGNCIAPITNYLADQVDRWVRSKTLEFSFDVNEKSYSVAFLPERTSAVTVAQEFCIQNAEELQLTNETVIPNCIQPMANFFQNTVREWVESKRVSVPVVIGEREVNVVFMPERESVINVARDVCLQQAESLRLTQANFIPDCVNPLSDILRKGLTNWIAERQQQQQQQAQQEQLQPAAN